MSLSYELSLEKPWKLGFSPLKKKKAFNILVGKLKSLVWYTKKV